MLRKTVVLILILAIVPAAGCLERSIERPKQPDEIDTKIAYQLTHYKNTRSYEAFSEILRFGSRAIPALDGALNDGDAGVRLLSVRLLYIIDPSNPKLPYMLNDPMPKITVETAFFAGACRTDNAVPLLISVMRKNGQDVLSIGKYRDIIFKNKETASEYISFSNISDDNKIRLACAWALLQYDAPWITEMLFENATEDADFKWLAAAISGKCASFLDEPVLLKLAALATDEMPYIQAQAAGALGETRNPEILTPLFLLLDSPDKETADSSAIAIHKILASMNVRDVKSKPFPEDMDELRIQLKAWWDENHEPYEKDFSAFVKRASCGLVIEGRITGIKKAEPPATPASWEIEIEVLAVRRGSFNEKKFKLRLQADEEPLVLKGGHGEFVFVFYLKSQPDGQFSLDWIENKN
ncbi:MAG: HEAT repeat domain-containing protein [Planctomycetes bacterium]|nr:HEAT repeat domain-containing protein [Planctomycetota bacterium]